MLAGSEKMMVAPSKRLLFLDLFRGIFALLMIEGHTVRALLDPSLKANPVFGFHELLHNLPGPAFLFASGAAFSVATLTHWDSYHRRSQRLWRRLARYLVLLLLGYMLHLTYFSLSRTVSEGTADQWIYLFSVDILQCIALTALLLQFLVILLPRPQWFFWAAAGLSAVIGLTTPFAWMASRQIPWWLGTTLSNFWGSIYPLFPYAGFQLAGAAWGYLFIRSRQRETEANFLEQARRGSVWLVCGSLAVTFLPLPEAYSDFWMTGPTFFFLRVGILGFLAVTFRRVELRQVPGLRAVTLLGRESLTVYVIHLLLLHGSALNPDRNLLKLLGSPRPAMDTALVLLLLTVGMILLGWSWNRLKEGYRWPAKSVQWTLAGYLAYSFLSR